MLTPLIAPLNRLNNVLGPTQALDFLAPLALRLYLVPVFWMAGTNKHWLGRAALPRRRLALEPGR